MASLKLKVNMQYIIHYIFFSLLIDFSSVAFDISYSPIEHYYKILEQKYSMLLISSECYEESDGRRFIDPAFNVLKSPSTQRDCFKFWLDLSKEVASEISNIRPDIIITNPTNDIFRQNIDLYFLYPDLTQRMYPDIGAIRKCDDAFHLVYYKIEDFNLISMTKKITVEEFIEVSKGKKTLDFDPENDPSIKLNTDSKGFHAVAFDWLMESRKQGKFRKSRVSF